METTIEPNPSTPTPPPVNPTPAPSTFSTPPEKSNSKFIILLVILIILLLVTVALASYYFFIMKKGNLSNPLTQTTQPTATITPNPTSEASTEATLEKDSADIEINMSDLQNQADSIDSGLAEPTPNL